MEVLIMIQTYWPMYSNVSEIEVAGILNILLNLKKGTKMMQYFLYYTYYSQITNSAKVDLLLAFHLY